jgi:hypothetical protein
MSEGEVSEPAGKRPPFGPKDGAALVAAAMALVLGGAAGLFGWFVYGFAGTQDNVGIGVMLFLWTSICSFSIFFPLVFLLILAAHARGSIRLSFAPAITALGAAGFMVAVSGLISPSFSAALGCVLLDMHVEIALWAMIVGFGASTYVMLMPIVKEDVMAPHARDKRAEEAEQEPPA